MYKKEKEGASRFKNNFPSYSRSSPSSGQDSNWQVNSGLLPKLIQGSYPLFVCQKTAAIPTRIEKTI